MNVGEHPLYGVWGCLNNRCLQPHHPAYYAYGGRGISVCEEWRKVPGRHQEGQAGFWAFVSYVERELGEKPTPNHSLDRTENDGHYEPGNVEWKDNPNQSGNRRPYSRPNHKVGVSGFRGVRKHGKKWAATIKHKGKSIHLGTYETPEEASVAYEEKRRELRGDA